MNDRRPTNAVANSTPPLELRLDVDMVKGELALQDPSTIQADSTVDAELDQKAQHYANLLVNLDPGDLQGQNDSKAAVEYIGRELQREAARHSKTLQQPIRELSQHGADGGLVASALIDLKIQVEELDPNRFEFSAGWATRWLGMIPGIGAPVKRYFSKYESAQTVIDAIIRSLEGGSAQLERDNVTLSEDQRQMRELTMKLERQILLAQLLDQKLQYKLERELPLGDPRQKFVKEELLFPLRQRIMDLQQQIAVALQGVLSMAIIIQNNTELIRGVNRSIDVTVSALQVAVTVALALAHQKIVLDKVSALNTTTSNLIAGTAARLRTQGTSIQTQASQTTLKMDALKSAFADINAAMDEISRFRQEALPRMAETILEFNQLTATSEEVIQRMEQGTRARPTLQIDAG